MKRLIAAFVLAAAAGYAIARFAGESRGTPEPSMTPPSGFALNGLVAPDDVAPAARSLAGLAAQHCADNGGADFPVALAQLAPPPRWAGAATAGVYCPDKDTSSRDSFRGFWGRCDGGRVDLYVRVGGRSIDDLAGCVVGVGVDNLTPLDASDGASAARPGDRVRAAFQADDHAYVWVERDDRDGRTASDLILPIERR